MSPAFLAPPPLPITRPPTQSLPSITSCATTPPIAFVLSQFEAADLLDLVSPPLHPHPIPHPITVNLGKTTLTNLIIHPNGISLPTTPPAVHIATWSELAKIAKNRRTAAYEIYNDGLTIPQKIATISPTTNRPISLYPFLPNAPPTLLLAGFTMHRMKRTNPAIDTTSKLTALTSHAPLHGSLLDICTGLGYTAIAAANHPTVTSVTTIELDQAVVNIQSRNPWSHDLFTNPLITRLVADACVALQRFPDRCFDAVIHDPPAHALAGDLYSEAFYRQLRRVCRNGATLFHYIGDPDSRESGRLFKGVANRLVQAGFNRVTVRKEAYGVSASAA